MKKIIPDNSVLYTTADACLRIARLSASKHGKRKVAEKFSVLVTQDDDPHCVRRAVLWYESVYRFPEGGIVAFGSTSSGRNLLRGIRSCIIFIPKDQRVRGGLFHLLDAMLVDIDGRLYQPAEARNGSTKITNTRAWNEVRSQRGGWRRACVSIEKRTVTIDGTEFEFEHLFPRSRGISKARIRLLTRCVQERIRHT